MLNANLIIRTAYFSALQNLVYKTKTIPVFEEQVNESAPLVMISVGGIQVQAYIILLNQVSNDISSKCGRSDEASIQVQVNTIFPRGKGGMKTAEEISQLIYTRLLETDLGVNGLWSTQMPYTRNIPYNTDTSSAWCLVCLFTNRISQ